MTTDVEFLGALEVFYRGYSCLCTSPNRLFERERRVKLKRTFSPASLRPHTPFCAPAANSKPGNSQSVRASPGPGCQLLAQGSVSYCGSGISQLQAQGSVSYCGLHWRDCQCCLRARRPPRLGAGEHLQGWWKCRVLQLCRVGKCIMSSYHKVSQILFIYLFGRARIPGIFGWFVLLFFCLCNFFFFLKETRPPCRGITSP